MKYNGGIFVTGRVTALLLMFLVSGCGPKAVHLTASASQADYIAAAGTQPEAQQAGEGSLWVAQGRYSNLFRDFKARQVNDILTILVSETTQANAAADATNNKQSTAQIGFDNLFGAEKKVAEVTSGVNGSGSTTFKGSGSTTRASTLSTTVAARVKSVLPNGYLVIEGVREIRLNNENQTIYLTGIVRPEDISARNVVLSGSIAQMEVRVQGRGIVSQPLNPGWLYRILSGIFPF
jgi:flagellar L-ring protein precursor FlgH